MKNIGLFLAFILTAGFVYVFGYNNPVIPVSFGDYHYNIEAGKSPIVILYLLCKKD